jgi:hypothetical protein
MDWGRLILTSLIAGVSVFASTRWTARAKVLPNSEGWRFLAPSELHWTGLGLSAIIAGITSFVNFDPSQQQSCCMSTSNAIALNGLMVFFGLSTLMFVVWIALIFRKEVSWSKSEIKFVEAYCARKYAFDQVQSITESWSGYILLHFTDGVSLCIDPYAFGASDLIRRVSTRINRKSALLQAKLWRSATEVYLVEMAFNPQVSKDAFEFSLVETLKASAQPNAVNVCQEYGPMHRSQLDYDFQDGDLALLFIEPDAVLQNAELKHSRLSLLHVNTITSPKILAAMQNSTNLHFA